MEIGVSLAGSLISATLPKLLKVINQSEWGDLKVDARARSIEMELKLIQVTIQEASSSIGRDMSGPLQRECIAQLRRLADEMEDCLDLFHVGKTSRKQFCREMDEVKARSKETFEHLLSCMSMAASLAASSSTRQQLIMQEAPPPPLVRDQELADLEVFLSTYECRSRPPILNCLLYFCMFPPDRPARRNPLIRRWLSEGLVQREKDAVKNLEALIDHRIVDTIQVSNNGKAKSCQPHDDEVLLGYISDQSMSLNFMVSCDDGAACRQAAEAGYVRRLSLHHPSNGRGGSLIPHYKNLSRLRTLAVFPAAAANYDVSAASSNLARLEVLRVLDLKECSHLGEHHLKAICNLLLLKYLSFGGAVATVPRRIARLQCLETLDLRRTTEASTRVITLHAEAIQLPKLKHLFGKFQLSPRDSSSRSRMEKLGKFLTEESNLETLSGFIAAAGFPQLMSHMKRLRKVKAWCEDPTADGVSLTHLLEAIREFVREGNTLPRSLSIDFQEFSLPFPDTIKAPGSLVSLKLRGNLSQFPELVTKLNNIEELCLEHTNLAGDTIIGGLSSLITLKYLKLVEQDLGPLVMEPHHLPSLERMCLVGAQGLDIKIQAGALLRLVSLHLLSPALRLLPGIPGATDVIEITHMAGLMQVGLHSGIQKSVRDGWQEAAKGHPNVPELISITPSP